MQFRKWKSEFDDYMGVKTHPNDHEIYLLERAQRYIRKLSWIPGLRMAAIVNSVSMYATHYDSDIDLFIVTKKGYLWLVRVLVTMVFFVYGVWRKGKEVRGNFCLSFFVDESALNLEKIAIHHDIYLYYWIYYMKPILESSGVYEALVNENAWVEIEESQQHKNRVYLIKDQPREYPEFFLSGCQFLNRVLLYFGEKKTKKTHQKLGNPEGVIIDKHMLKFHDKDRRKVIRDEIQEIIGQN